MTAFDLLFILLFLASIISLIVAAVAAARGRFVRAGRIVRTLSIGLAVYMACVATVSLATPQQYAAVGADQCSDDWCIAVVGAGPGAATDSVYQVDYRLSSRARRISQRERFVATYVLDEQGRRFDPIPDPTAVPFDTLLSPIQSISASRRFDLPGGVNAAGVVVTRSGGGLFPRCCIIGEGRSVLHRPTIVRLEQHRAR